MDKQEKANLARVQKEVTIHAVIYEKYSTKMEVHTHGLTAYGQTELQVLANSLFMHSAFELLNTMAYAVIIIKGETLEEGEVFDYGEWGRFTLMEESDSAGDPILRVKPITPACEACGDSGLNLN